MNTLNLSLLKYVIQKSAKHKSYLYLAKFINQCVVCIEQGILIKYVSCKKMEVRQNVFSAMQFLLQKKKKLKQNKTNKKNVMMDGSKSASPGVGYNLKNTFRVNTLFLLKCNSLLSQHCCILHLLEHK